MTRIRKDLNMPSVTAFVNQRAISSCTKPAQGPLCPSHMLPAIVLSKLAEYLQHVCQVYARATLQEVQMPHTNIHIEIRSNVCLFLGVFGDVSLCRRLFVCGTWAFRNSFYS